jgi:hypothetical protein
MLRPLYIIRDELLEFIKKSPKEALRIAELYGIECQASIVVIEPGKPILQENGPTQVYWGCSNAQVDIRDFEIEAGDLAIGDWILTTLLGGYHHLLVTNDMGDKQHVQVLLNIIIECWENVHVSESCGRCITYCAAIRCEARAVENLKPE